MTAIATTEARVEIVGDLLEATRLLQSVAERLPLTIYPDTSMVASDRGKLKFAANVAGIVRDRVTGLGTDPEARD